METPAVRIYLQLCPLKSPSVTSDISTDKASNNSTEFPPALSPKDCKYSLIGWTNCPLPTCPQQQLSHSTVLPLPSPRSALPARSPLSSAAMFSCSTDRGVFFFSPKNVIRHFCETRLGIFRQVGKNETKIWARCLKLTTKRVNYERH